ncbi:MAG TPA: RNA-binding protein, partial [Candidatus Micrarchaeota archaeon]|nr:RNA-binding protein [Candidatus Micrarchaeota archaeon]
DKFELGDVVYCRIMNADEVKNIDLTEARKLVDGRVIRFSAVKIPRLIGKRNSMINMIRNACDTDIVIGRNGYVWLSDRGNSSLAIETILKIEHEAHISGLTDRIHA